LANAGILPRREELFERAESILICGFGRSVLTFWSAVCPETGVSAESG